MFAYTKVRSIIMHFALDKPVAICVCNSKRNNTIITSCPSRHNVDQAFSEYLRRQIMKSIQSSRIINRLMKILGIIEREREGSGRERERARGVGKEKDEGEMY